jgi:membrane associated rhomboid family serine protease
MRGYSRVSLNAIWFLIAANLLVFIFTLIWPEKVVLLFGLMPAYFLHQPWTIVTNLFVHAGFGHILCNMISLFFLGSFLIRMTGGGKFLLIYFLGGLLGNLFFIVYYTLLPPPYPVMGIGASGAIFALGGALAVLAPKVRVFIFPIPVPMPLWVAIVIFLAISFIPGNIAWQAHIGGLILGLGAGYYLRKGGKYYRI